MNDLILTEITEEKLIEHINEAVTKSIQQIINIKIDGLAEILYSINNDVKLIDKRMITEQMFLPLHQNSEQTTNVDIQQIAYKEQLRQYDLYELSGQYSIPVDRFRILLKKFGIKPTNRICEIPEKLYSVIEDEANEICDNIASGGKRYNTHDLQLILNKSDIEIRKAIRELNIKSIKRIGLSYLYEKDDKMLNKIKEYFKDNE